MKASSGGDRLCRLVSGFQAGRVEVGDFCARYERLFNLEIDKSSLEKKELEQFDWLFERVVWFSPVAEERAEIPNYLDEEAIKSAASDVLDELKSGS